MPSDQGRRRRLGPDLTNIGAERSSDYLRESIIDPNAHVARRYWVATFQSNDGSSYSGYLLDEDTYTVRLIDFDGQLHSLAKGDLKDFTVEKIRGGIQQWSEPQN